MFNWLRRRRSIPDDSDAADTRTARRKARVSGPHLVFFEYLENRYASAIVLTFAEIEDLLGSALPAQAHSVREWWTNAVVEAGTSKCSDSWLLAHRSATPNLLARTVLFERAI